MGDLAAPDEQWSKDSLELLNKLSELTTHESGWIKCDIPVVADGSRGFQEAVVEKGKFIEYSLFVNSSRQTLKGVVQFGKYTRGLPGFVHGGAVATVLDGIFGICAFYVNMPSLISTVNLSVNYKRAVPLNSSCLAEAKIERVEGRKMFLSGSLKSACGKITYATATSIFLNIGVRSKL